MPSPAPHLPELLAPAGDEAALRAAVANGADAVYFGLSDFNARQRAANFTLAELPRLMQYLHDHGVRGYVTFNTLIFSEELEQAAENLQQIAQAGADAVIVQDLGLVRLIRRLAPQLPIHGSTQMTLTESRGIDFVQALGAERVIVARELSLAEIRHIRETTAVPLEVFVHGALCVAYSGQCLTSEALGGRSANRGQCAQACRQPYQLLVDGTVRELGELAYLLSPQDLAAHDLVGDLAAAGVCSLKIEGRLKSAQYVAATTQTYRAALEAAARGQPFEPTARQQLDLAQSFSRGFTAGFLKGVNHQELVQGKFPKHRGVRIGIVERISTRSILITVDPELIRLTAGSSNDFPLPLMPGDGIVFDEGHPEQDEQGGRVYTAHWNTLPARTQASEGRAPRSERPLQLEVTLGQGAVNLGAIACGATVWKTDDPAFRRRLERTYADEPVTARVPVRCTVEAAIGELLQITLADLEGRSVTVVWEEHPLPAARKHSLTLALLREQLGRLGGTPFLLDDLQLRTTAGTSTTEIPVMVPKSVLNDLRRDVVERLRALRTSPPPRPLNLTALTELRGEVRKAAGITGPAMPPVPVRLTVLARTLAQVHALCDWQQTRQAEKRSGGDSAGGAEASAAGGLAYLACDFEDVRAYRAAVQRAQAIGLPVALATPRIIKPREAGLLKQVAHCQPTAVLVRNLAALSYYRENYPALVLRGDYSLNVANELTAQLFLDQGLTRLVPSYDLNLEQLRQMLRRIDPEVFELVIHQHMPMFHMEHCVYSHVLSNGKDWHDCGRPCDQHRVELRDHVGEAHPLAADVGCRNTVFNAHAQSAALYLPRLREWGLREFRVELLREDEAETGRLLESYSQAIRGEQPPPATWQTLHVLNQLGVTRGTLEFA